MGTHFPNLGAASNGADPKPAPNGATVPASPSVASLPKQAWQYAQSIRTPDDPIVKHRVEFIELSQKVRAHLMNQIGTHTRDQTARLLWVQGKPGEGKSEGCLMACLAAGFHVAEISPGIFAGETEGAPVQVLHDLLDEMARWSIIHRVRTVLQLDDFDLSTANVPEKDGKTVNSQLLTNEMMQLASKRHLYRNWDGSNIGLILTVNNATGMRSSLTRPGRSDWYDHTPSNDDRANIAWAVLDPKTTAERDLVHALVRKNIRQPVTFWQALYFKMRELHGQNLIKSAMPEKAAVDQAYGQRMPLLPEVAWEAARQLRKQAVTDYITQRTWWRR